MSTAALGPKPQKTYCPICQTNVTSKLELKSTMKTHVWAFLLCVIGFWPCSVCLYCTQWARNAEHYCPSCDTYLGIYER